MGTIRTASGNIFTFYSYKGGPGRSMVLANVACLLAQGKKKGNVLMIDWDLEAPGLHLYFQNNIDNSLNKSFGFDTHPGLIDLFYEMRFLCEQKQMVNEDISDSFFNEIELEKYIIKINMGSLYLMSAGQFNKRYASRVNSFNWEEFFNHYPSLIFRFSEYLSSRFNYILIDSRTGHTDISGICTALMPDKLIVVFTPNKQSISGVIDIAKMAVEYRKQSDDLRQLLVFPLVSRVEPAEPQLRQDWRFGNKGKNIIGYQTQFENLFNDIYRLDKCDLTSYFDDVQIQYIPRYAYGEEVAVLAERSEDRLSLAKSYETFVDKMFEKQTPWDILNISEEIPPISYKSQPQKKPKTSTIQRIVEQMSGVIDRYLHTNLNYFTADEISDYISDLENIRNEHSYDDEADVLLGYISQVISHLYVAEGYATDDVPRNIEYYRNMESARRLFREIKGLRGIVHFSGEIG
jgi:MinD-like ATPase involved in chromosome partitioning or flagellar assembly